MINETENNTGQELIKSSSTSLQTTESLPVLAAFSDFIKTEQLRSRNRMLIMGFLFTLMIIIIIGAGGFVGTAFYNQVHADLRQTKSDLNSYHIKSEIEKSRTEEKLFQIQALASNIAHNISQQKQELLATQKSFNSNKDSYQQELADMKQVVDSLSIENKKLKEDSEQANIKLPQLTAQLNDLLSIITSPVTLQEDATPTETIPVIPKSTVAAIPKSITEVIDINTIDSKPVIVATPEYMESTEIIEDTSSSLELNIPTQEKDSSIMMLMPIPE